jgi:hypothetical protein
MPTRRLSNPGVIQILSLHIPVLNSASDHFLVQQGRHKVQVWWLTSVTTKCVMACKKEDEKNESCFRHSTARS